jgi:hypothetical protein
MIKGAKKCYKEIKTLRISGADSFTMRDIDTNKTFIFKIHHPYISNQQNGGSLPNDKDKIESLIAPSNENDKIGRIEENIKALQSRMEKVENTVIIAIDKYNNVTAEKQNNDDTCIIM